MDIISLLQYTLNEIVETFSHNWFLHRNTKNSVLMSTGLQSPHRCAHAGQLPLCWA